MTNKLIADPTMPIEVSARHVHLSQEHQDILFGPGYTMTIKKQLSQTGQWAAEEKITVKGPKGSLECRVLGPCRPKTQVEFAWSDGYKTGINVPVRESMHHEGTPGCTLVGPNGEVTLEAGVIDPQRHAHMSEVEAEERGLQKNDILSMYIPGPQALHYHNLVVRTHPTFHMNVHLDTDEGNACSLPTFGARAQIVRVTRGEQVVWIDPKYSDYR